MIDFQLTFRLMYWKSMPHANDKVCLIYVKLVQFFKRYVWLEKHDKLKKVQTKWWGRCYISKDLPVYSYITILIINLYVYTLYRYIYKSRGNSPTHQQPGEMCKYRVSTCCMLLVFKERKVWLSGDSNYGCTKRYLKVHPFYWSNW